MPTPCNVVHFRHAVQCSDLPVTGPGYLAKPPLWCVPKVGDEAQHNIIKTAIVITPTHDIPGACLPILSQYKYVLFCTDRLSYKWDFCKGRGTKERPLSTGTRRNFQDKKMGSPFLKEMVMRTVILGTYLGT